MSSTIDRRIVEMKFDNKNFEQNIADSARSLESFKNKLKFDEASKSFDELNRASSRVSFDGLQNALVAVQDKFSVMGTFADQIIRRIADGFVDATQKATSFVKSLSVDQIAAGWGKYGEKQESVQTIMNATGKSVEEVGEQLKKLQWFTDETSYNFIDMTSNIGKFTNNGVELETAVDAMMGIANWAGVSGANVSEASRAMYNLSQAISVGSVKLIDWKSIENANMATTEFKQNVIDTALELEYLKDEGNGVYKTMSGDIVSVNNFNSALSEGWFSSEVLLKTLTKYSDYTNAVYEIADSYDTCSEAMEHVSEEGMELGAKAFKASQEYKTFKDAIDATKDAVSSGWMESFEIIFGDLEESKKLWTELGNTLWDIFASGAEKRNEFLQGLKDTGAIDSILNSIRNLYTGFSNLFTEAKQVFADVFGTIKVDSVTKVIKSIENVTKSFSESSEIVWRFRQIVSSVANVIKIVKDVIVAVLKPFKNLFTVSNGFMDTFDYLIGSFSAFLTTLQSSEKYANFLTKVSSVAGTMVSKIQKVIGTLSRFVFTMIDLFSNRMLKAKKGASKFVLMFSRILQNLVKVAFDVFRDITGIDLTKWRDKIVNVIISISNWVIKKIPVIKTVFENLKNKLAPVFEWISDKFTKLKELLFGKKTEQQFDNAMDRNYSFVDAEEIEESNGLIAKIIRALKTAKEKVQPIFDWFHTTFDKLKEKFFGKKEAKTAESQDVSVPRNYMFVDSAEIEEAEDQPVTFLQKIQNAFQKAKDALQPIFDWFQDKFQKLKDSFYGDEEGEKKGFLATLMEKLAPAINFFKAVWNVISAVWEKLKPILLSIWNFVTDLLNGIAGAIRNSDTSSFEDGLSSIFSVEEILAGGGIDGIIIVVKKLLGSISDLFGGVSDMFGKEGKLSQTFDSVMGIMEAAQKSIKADIIKKIATAIAIMAVSLLLLASVEPDRLAVASGAIVGLVGDLILALNNFQNINMDNKQAKNLSKTLLTISAAILILSLALKSLAKLSWKEMLVGITAISIMLGEITGVIKILGTGKTKNFSKAATGILIMAVALMLLVKPVKKLGELDTETLIKGVAAVSILLAVMTASAKILSSGLKKSGVGLISAAAAITIMALSIRLLVKPIKEIGSMSLEAVAKGVLAISVSLLAMTLALKYLPADAAIRAAGIAAVSAALLLVGQAMNSIGSLKWGDLAKGLLGIVVAIAAITIAIKALPMDAATRAVGIAVVSASLLLMAEAIKQIGRLKLKTIAKGVLAIAATLLILVAAMKVANSAVFGAAAILIVSAALLALVPAIKSFGSMNIVDIGKALLVIAGALTIFIAAAYLLQGAIPGVIALTVVMAAFGASTLMIGTGLLLAATALNVFAASLEVLTALGAPAIAMILLLVEGFIQLIPKFAAALVEGIVAFTVVLAENVPVIAEAVLQMLLGLILVITEAIPAIAAALLQFIIELLESILSNIGAIVDMVMKILIGIIIGISNNIGALVTALIDLICNLISTLGKNMTKIMLTVAQFIIDVINAVARTIRSKANKYYDAIKNLVKAIWYLIKTFVTRGIKDVKELGRKILESGFVQGIKDKINTIKETFQEGLDNAIQTVKDTISNWIQTGKDLIMGFINGIIDKSKEIFDTLKELCGSAWSIIAKLFGIESPSRLMMWAGQMIDEGFAIGIDQNADSVYDSTAGLANSSVDSFSEALSKVYDMMDEDMDYNPTITPVIDLDEAKKGLTDLNGLTKNRSLGISAYAASSDISNRRDRAANQATNPEGVMSSNETNTICINVYGAEGQDVNELADAVVNRINSQLNRRKAVFA